MTTKAKLEDYALLENDAVRVAIGQLQRTVEEALGCPTGAVMQEWDGGRIEINIKPETDRVGA